MHLGGCGQGSDGTRSNAGGVGLFYIKKRVDRFITFSPLSHNGPLTVQQELEDDITSRRCSSQTARAAVFAAGNHASINISDDGSTASDAQEAGQPSQQLESDEDSGSEDGDSGPLDDTQPFTEHVVLQRGQKGFGFNIKKSMGAGPLLIGKIAPEGEASKHPELQPGARIVSINGHDTTSLSRGEIWRQGGLGLG